MTATDKIVCTICLKQTQIEPYYKNYLRCRACGLRTVDQSAAVIAFWDGQPAAGRGGTAEIVEYVRKQQKPLLWIHAATGEITAERLDKLFPATRAAGRGASLL